MMTITIKKEDIYEEVAKIAGYSAKYKATKEDAPENTFRRTAIFDPYRTLLDDVFEKGCNHVTDAVVAVAPYEIGQGDDDEYFISADMPYNWNNALESELASTVKSYLVSHMASMWMRIIESEDEDKYFKDSSAHLLEITKLLHRKKRVGRKEFIEMLNSRRANSCGCNSSWYEV